MITQAIVNNAQAITIYDANSGTIQIPAVVVTTIMTGTTNSLAYSIKHPITFIYSTTATPQDWYTNNSTYQNNDLWSSTKTNYDPCPIGWKMPLINTWGDFVTTTFPVFGSGSNMINGRKYNQIAWYPAAGYRHVNSGLFYSVGNYGYCWASEFMGTEGQVMDFTMTVIHKSNRYFRAGGFPVRCVQE